MPHHLTTSRRSVLRAGAWSMPVVALAAAAPAASASTSPRRIIVGTDWQITDVGAPYPFEISAVFTFEDDGSPLSPTTRIGVLQLEGVDWSWNAATSSIDTPRLKLVGFWPDGISHTVGDSVSVAGEGYDRITEEFYTVAPGTATIV